jgi:hypothetical protein
VSIALIVSEVANAAAASAPPATAVVRSIPEPRPDREASLATEAVNRASEAAEISWPTTLIRAAPGFSRKYLSTSAGSDPGRG